MSTDSRYDYPVMAASKVIIRKGDRILLTREPQDNSWMPGRLGLPGGKYFLHEGITEGTKRKIDNEAGVKCDIKGLFKIVQILMPDKTVYHFIFVAEYTGENEGMEPIFSDGLEWVSKEETEKLTKDDVTEYYNTDVLREYFDNPDKLIPTESIREIKSFEDPEIQEWMRKGNKES